MVAADDILTIPEWLENQSIFITGVSGFIGKILLWKILKSCPGIDSVYVLIRSKKGKPPQERLDELLSISIFAELKKDNPEILKKVIALDGDICQERLGLQDSDTKLLQEKVTAVFNVAASIRFDDPLQKAIFTNTRSSKYAILLAKGMKKLKVFVHVSTAYTNCNRLVIPEKVIPSDFDPEKMIKVAETFTEPQLEIITEKLLKDYPNTYIFTKNLAENLVYQHRYEMPIVIYRPSIVISATKEPEPGWCDNVSGIVALMVAGGKGILRVVHAKYENCLDYITVDTCVNSIIASAWYRTEYLKSKKDIQDEEMIFNATDFQLPLGNLDDYLMTLIYQNPFKNQLWHCYLVYTVNTFIFHFSTFFLHFLPGLLVDGLLKLSGQRTRLMKVYRKLYVISVNLLPFNSYTFKFCTDNFKKLKTTILESDKEAFFMDSFHETTLETYFFQCLRGSKVLFKEEPYANDKDKAYTRRLYWIHQICKYALIALCVWLIPIRLICDWVFGKVDQYQEMFNRV